jgi:hypothetical protein
MHEQARNRYEKASRRLTIRFIPKLKAHNNNNNDSDNNNNNDNDNNDNSHLQARRLA